MRVLMITGVLLILLGIMMTSCSCGAAARVDQKIRESTDAGFDTAIKGRDMAMEGALTANFNSDPVLSWYYKQGHFTGSVSHAVVTLTGKVRTQELVDQLVELAGMVKGVKDVINELEVDPTIEEQPFEW